jgi:acetyltransferase-like isoleucine patch superfamily enzyme
VQLGAHSYAINGVCEMYPDGTELIVGKYTSIASGCTVYLGGNHRTDFISTFPFNVLVAGLEHLKGHPATKGSVYIGNDVWIGANVTIMSGVTIGDGAVIAACSVVTKPVGCYEIWAGNPAKKKRQRFKTEDVNFLFGLQWWDFPDERVLELAPILMSGNIAALREAVK